VHSPKRHIFLLDRLSGNSASRTIVQVESAAFGNGLLKIELFREIPEAMKPRRIAINGAPTSNVHQLEGKAA